MAPPVNEPGHLPDVTALIVTKEADVTTVLRTSREIAARNVHKITMEIIVVMTLVNYLWLF